MAPRVAFSLLVRAGKADETAQNAGWRRLLVEAMLRATQSTQGGVVTLAQRNRQAQDLGGRIAASVGDDVIEFYVTGDSANANQLIDLLLRTVTTPRLSEDDVTKARESLNARREIAADDIAATATGRLSEQLYVNAAGKAVAYGLPDLGTEESLAGLTSAGLRESFNRYFGAKQMVAAAVGDVDVAALRARLKTSVGTAQPMQAPAATVVAPRRLTGEASEVVTIERTFACARRLGVFVVRHSCRQRCGSSGVGSAGVCFRRFAFWDVCHSAC
jgi:predicted Zn-dependent peptidase